MSWCERRRFRWPASTVQAKWTASLQLHVAADTGDGPADPARPAVVARDVDAPGAPQRRPLTGHVGCPANGSSEANVLRAAVAETLVKIRTRWSAIRLAWRQHKVDSDRFVQRVNRSISSIVRPSPSSTTATGLPEYGVVVNTST